ncbi:hypothetical protein [Streptomyces sp. NPDC050564]|uniref:hypothetical protein n=1 Tax=Streptomyces sp. NPDC050564 TaxID=3365631 RepID=UPI003797E06B
MAAVTATLIGLLILGALVYDITRLFGSEEPRRPPLARLRWPARRSGGRGVARGGPAPSP